MLKAYFNITGAQLRASLKYLSSYSIQNQFSLQSLPGELAREAWKTEKLMRAYEARKKLEMMGAMMFNSANRPQKRGSVIKTSGKRFVIRWRTTCKQLTNEDEGEANTEGQDITTQRLVVLPITLRKHTQPWIDVVLAQSLESHQLLCIHSFYIICLNLSYKALNISQSMRIFKIRQNKMCVISDLEDFGCADQRGQSRGQSC